MAVQVRLLLFQFESSRALSSDSVFCLVAGFASPVPMWNRILPPQCAFINGKGHHFKKNHCPWTWQKSVSWEVIVEVNLVFVERLSHIQLPHVIAGVVNAINGVTKTKLTSATARKLLDPDDGIDVKKLDNSTMRKGKKVFHCW